MKKRFIIAGIIFLIMALLVLPVLAADTHALLLKDLSKIIWHPLEGFSLIVLDERVRKLYLIFLAATAMCLLWVLINGNYLNYRSDMQVITPDIITPRPDGQGQFGTARWLPKEQIGRFFTVWKIPRRNTWFRELMVSGKTDRKEVQNANIKIQ